MYLIADAKMLWIAMNPETQQSKICYLSVKDDSYELLNEFSFTPSVMSKHLKWLVGAE